MRASLEYRAAKILYTSSSLGMFFLEQQGETYYADDRPILINNVRGVNNRDENKNHIAGAVVQDAQGNKRIFGTQITDSFDVFVKGNPCRNANNHYEIDNTKGGREIKKLVLSRIENAEGLGADISYEKSNRLNIPEKIIQRIHSDMGRVTTVEYKFWWRGPYEIFTSRWYFPTSCGYYTNYDRATDEYRNITDDHDCMKHLRNYFESSDKIGAIPRRCHFATMPPQVPACVCADCDVGERKEPTYTCDDEDEWKNYPPVFGWDHTGVYKYILQPIISKVIDNEGRENIFHYDEQSSDMRENGPLLTHIERRAKDGTSFVLQYYSYSGDKEKHLLDVRDSDRNVIARWEQESIGNSTIGRQFVGGDNAVPITYEPSDRASSLVTTREGINWKFELDPNSAKLSRFAISSKEIRLESTFERDEIGRLKRQTLPDGRTVEYEYRADLSIECQHRTDVRGRPHVDCQRHLTSADVDKEVWGTNTVFFSVFDVKEITETTPDGYSKWISIDYDNPRHQPISITENGGRTTRFEYCVDLGPARCPCMVYDFLARKTYPDGRTEEFVPDKKGRIAEYKDLAGTISRIYYTTNNDGCSPYGVLR